MSDRYISTYYTSISSLKRRMEKNYRTYTDFVGLLLTTVRILIQNKLRSNKTTRTYRSNVAVVADIATELILQQHASKFLLLSVYSDKHRVRCA